MEKQTSSSVSKASEMIREALTKKQSRNSSYSTRAFARDLGMSHSFVSMVLSGKRKLSLERAKEVSALLEMSARDRSRFLREVTIGSARKTSSSRDIEKILFGTNLTGQYIPVEVDEFQFFQHWYHVALLELPSCTNFQNDIDSIAQRLGLEKAIVAGALDRLVRLKLLKNVDGKWVKTKRHISVPTTKSEEAVRGFHAEMLDKAKEVLAKADQKDFERRSISGTTMAIDPSKVEEAKKAIRDFKKKMTEFLTDGNATTEVYQLNIQLFPLTEKAKDET